MLDQEWLKTFKVVEFGYTEEPQPIHYENYLNWIEGNKHLPLKYLEDHRKELRSDVRKYYPEFQSALVFLFSYHQEKRWLDNFYSGNKSNGLKIASYTLGFKGHDYHHEIRQSLGIILNKLKESYPKIEGVISLDIHPVLERDLALRAGLGFQGKNSMFISKKNGSFFIIGSLLLNQKLNFEIKKIDTDHCGQCTRCIDSCPTKAIEATTRTIISKDCISTFTIEEFKIDSIPSTNMDLGSGYIFGCDICQSVCPWNLRLERKLPFENVNLDSKAEEIVKFFLQPKPSVVKDSIEKQSNNEFNKMFKGTSFERSGKRGILKNLIFYLKNKR